MGFMSRFLVKSFLCLAFLSGGFGAEETRAKPLRANFRSEFLQHGLSNDSVKRYLSNIFRKPGAANRSEAITIAHQKHLLKA